MLSETIKDLNNLNKGHRFRHDFFTNLDLYIRNRVEFCKSKELSEKINTTSFSSLFFSSLLLKFIEGTKSYFDYYVDFRKANFLDLAKDFLFGSYIWGNLHEHHPYQRASAAPIVFDRDKGMGLGVLTTPQVQERIKGFIESIALFHNAVVTSKLNLSYGFYLFEVTQMPKHLGFFPALWVISKKSWPPEVDLVEQRIVQNGDKLEALFETNVLYGAEHEKESVRSIKSVSHKNREIDGKLYFGAYVGVTEIAIFYGSELVRIVTDDKILSYFSNQENQFEIVMNNAVLESQMHHAFRNILSNYEDNLMFVSRFAYHSGDNI
jgi:hypothetical protein